MNKTEELYWFGRFKDVYDQLPEGEIVHTDKPDFIFEDSNCKVGIEVTQIFRDNTFESPLNEKRKENLHGMLGQSLCDKLEAIIPCPFILNIGWSRKMFSNRDIPRITAACSDYIKRLSYPTEDYHSIDIINEGQLPEEIVRLSFLNFPTLDKPFYENSNGGRVVNMKPENLKVVLDKKEKALKNYLVCDEFWLLIIEGSFFSDSFGDIIVEAPITTFSKILIYRVKDNEVIQIK